MDHNIKKLVQEVLEQGYLMSLGTVDDGGVWVADVLYIFDDELNVYWMSSQDVRHSKAILQNSKVAATITVNLPKQDNFGIQLEGIAQKIDGVRYDLAVKHFTKRQRPAPKEAEDVLKGRFWYRIKPTKIELICEKYFGFEKQIVSL